MLRDAIAHRSVAEQADGRFSYKFDPRWFGLPSRGRVTVCEVRCPALVLRGAESRLLTPEGADEVAGELRAAELAVIEGAGHNLHLDRPKAVLDSLRSFLARLA